MLHSINFADLMPLEADDEVIFEQAASPAQGGESPCFLQTAFNIHSRVFWTALENPGLGVAGRKESPSEWERLKDPILHVQHVEARLSDLKYMLDDITPELRQWAPVTFPLHARKTSGSDHEHHTRLQSQQLAIVRANLHVTHLWLQSILLDQLDAANQNNATICSDTFGADRIDARQIWNQREDLCRQLLHLLHSIPLDSLEPNGLHLTYKVRDVAVALLNCPFEPQEEPARRATAYLRDFSAVLSRLDGSEIMNTLSLQSWVDTDRRHWNGC